MNLQELLKESFQPEQASLIENAIAQAIEAQVVARLAEATADAATAQAQVAQKSADDIENISNTYDVEMKKAAKAVVDLEKFYNKQINVAVDKIVTAYDDADRASAHYDKQLKEAAEMFVRETADGSLQEANEQIAKYVAENAALSERAQQYGEYAYQEGLQEAQSLVEEATARFIQENQEKFDRLDEMARYEKIVNSIKETYETNALGLSEDEAYKGLQEAVESKDVEITGLQESIAKLKAELFENQKASAFENMTKSLSESQKDKLKGVSDAIIAEDVATYSRTLGFLVEAQTVTVKEKTVVESAQDLITNANQQNTKAQSLNEASLLGSTPGGMSEADYVKYLTSAMK